MDLQFDKKYYLYNDDCLEVLPTLDVKVDLVLTDPPYGTTACKWDSVIPFNEMWDCIDKITNDNTPILLFGTEPFSSALRFSNIDNYKYDWFWKKGRFSNFLTVKKQPGRVIENICVFYKKPPLYNPQMRNGYWYRVNNNASIKKRDFLGNMPVKDFKKAEQNGKYPINILEYKMHNRDEYNLHPTQKPVPLLEYLIKTYTNKGDIVLDFTMGSGSTGVACANTGRKFIGIELEDKYYKIAEKRINDVHNQKKLL